MKCFPLIPPFLGQDPKYPVENLLLEERVQPWLCCPLDRSRQLRAELQLEHAGCIGYIDVGNSGSAFLQIEASPESARRPGVSSGVFGGTLSPAGPSSGPQEETLLKSQLQQLDLALHGLSRPAQLVLKAAASARKRAPLLPAGSPPPPAARNREAAQSLRAPSKAFSGDLCCRHVLSLRAQRGATRQEQPLENKEEIAGQRQARKETADLEEEEDEEKLRLAPAQSVQLLPVHASTCGEEAEVSSVGSWVECPLCQGRFPASEVEGHASGCGEEGA
ncbi:putative short transient receptor potential channel 2-like protein [Naja naja]|nr:putative short transient receptor potential channel 2-like protein [Naja naja]